MDFLYNILVFAIILFFLKSTGILNLLFELLKKGYDKYIGAKNTVQDFRKLEKKRVYENKRFKKHNKISRMNDEIN